MKTAADLVVDAAARHRFQSEQRLVVCRLLGAHEQRIEHRRLRELGGGAESTVLRVHGGQHQLEQPVGGEVGVRHTQQRRTIQRGEPLDDHARRPENLGAAFTPGSCEGLDQLGERRQAEARLRREIGAGEEGPPVRRAEDAVGPASLTGQRLGRPHERLIDVGMLLPVDLDRDE